MQNATYESENSVDSTLTNLRLTIRSYTGQIFTSRRWTVKSVALTTGANPSRAEAVIPAFSEDETEASHDASFWLMNLKCGMLAKVDAGDGATVKTILSGSITSISKVFDGGDIILSIEDHRWLLAGKQNTGVFLRDADGSSFVGSIPCIMNPSGQPNCILVGSNYIFCEPNFGLSISEAVPDEPTTERAAYWTPPRAFNYFRNVFFNTAYATQRYENSWMSQCDPARMLMRETISEKLKDEEFFSTLTRKSQQMDFEGQTAIQIFQSLCEMCGPYTMNAVPVGVDGINEFTVVKNKFDNTGISITRSNSGNTTSRMAAPIMVSGSMGEDGRNTFTRCAVQGETVYIERRVSTGSGGSYALIPAWSDAELAEFKASLGQSGNNTATAIKSFFRKHPNLFAAYRLAPAFDIYQGTSMAATHSAIRSSRNRTPLNELLSSKIETSSTTYLQKFLRRYKISVEISTGLGSPISWIPSPENTGIEIKPDGLILLNGLRQEVSNPSVTLNTWRGSVAAPNGIAANDVRMTLSIPADHRISGAVRLNNSYETPFPVPVLADASGDAERVEFGLDRLFYVSASDLYSFHERYNSFPVPPPAGTAATDVILRDDTELLLDHCRRRLADVGRVRRDGRFVFSGFILAYEIGMKIEKLKTLGGGEFPIRGTITGINYSCSSDENLTELLVQ